MSPASIKIKDIDRDIDLLARLFLEMEDDIGVIREIQLKYLHEHDENEILD